MDLCVGSSHPFLSCSCLSHPGRGYHTGRHLQPASGVPGKNVPPRTLTATCVICPTLFKLLQMPTFVLSIPPHQAQPTASSASLPFCAPMPSFPASPGLLQVQSLRMRSLEQAEKMRGSVVGRKPAAKLLLHNREADATSIWAAIGSGQGVASADAGAVDLGESEYLSDGKVS